MSGIAAYDGPSKGRLTLVHLYPREMSIYGDFGNVRALAIRFARHGYEVDVVAHEPGSEFPANADLVVGGGGQDSGQARVQDDLAAIGPRLVELAADGVPMLVVCGMYQLFGRDFTTVAGRTLPGLGILDVTTRGGAERMIGPVVVSTRFGDIVGYENHSGRTVRGEGQEELGSVLFGKGNDGVDGTEGAVRENVYGTYLHGPVLPANPAFSDELIRAAVERSLGRSFEPELLDDSLADEARTRQIERLLSSADAGSRSRLSSAAAIGSRAVGQVLRVSRSVRQKALTR